MKAKFIALAALLAGTSATFAQENKGDTNSPMLQESTLLQSRTRPLLVHAGVSPPLRSSKPNCSAWAKANTTSLKCSSFVRST